MQRIVLIAALAALWPAPGQACPGCNVFSYLYTSVRSSPNIVVGTVDRQTGEWTALVRVDQVLRGTNRPGDLAEFRMFNSSNHVGAQFVFSDPTECCPDFPVLPVDGKWEVSFLIRNAPFDEREPFGFYDMVGPEGAIKQTPERSRPVVKDAVEAILCLKGVSYVTRELGIQYAKEHPEQTLPLLRAEIARWVADLRVRETNSIAYHRLDGLIEAMWKADARDAGVMFAEEIAKRLARKPAQITVNNTSKPTLEASYVKSVLRHAKDAGHGEALKSQVLKALPSLRDQSLVTAIYALAHSESASLPDLEQAATRLVSLNPDQHLAVAVGFYQAGAEHARWWAWTKARGELSLARRFCVGPACEAVAKEIEEEIARADRWMKK